MRVHQAEWAQYKKYKNSKYVNNVNNVNNYKCNKLGNLHDETWFIFQFFIFTIVSQF